MIEDIEGAMSEPTRRGHVVALSAATAAVSLVLLLAIVAPRSVGTAPNEAARAPKASERTVTIVSDPTSFFRPDPLAGIRVNVTRVSECGTEISYPSYQLLDRTGRVIAVFVISRDSRAVPTAPIEDGGTGWLSMPCATSTFSVPRINRAR